MLRTTRQYVEVLSTGSGPLRVTRQYVEILAELPASPSPSPSLSVSPSSSLSVSPSLSISPSTSISPSQSLSTSPSLSVSPSPSLSISPSPSLSISPSVSSWSSVSPSSSSLSSISPSPAYDPSLLEHIDEFLADLLERRGKATVSGDSDRMCIEMSGGHVVEMTPFEPDALTFRNWYYYNTKTNTLMRKIVNKSTATAFWKRVGG